RRPRTSRGALTVRARTIAREAALKALYQLDLRSSVPDAEIEELIVREAQTPEAQDYARECVKGTRGHRDEIDKEISAVAENWDPAPWAPIDRTVLRPPLSEMISGGATPPAVAIKEAVTTGKKSSTKAWGGFVSGILNQIKNRRLSASTDEPR